MVTIREATEADIDGLAQLRTAIQTRPGNNRPTVDPAVFAAEVRTYLAATLGKDYRSWVAEDNGQLVGSIGLVLYRRPPTTDNMGGAEGLLMGFEHTLDASTGQALIPALVEQAAACARGLGARRIRLNAPDAGERTAFEKAGFSGSPTLLQLGL